MLSNVCEGLSLYRALLKASDHSRGEASESLRSFIRRRFKIDRLLRSPSQIANGLNAGRSFLELLNGSARGDQTSISKLSALIQSTLKLSDSNRKRQHVILAASGDSEGQSRLNNLLEGASLHLNSRKSPENAAQNATASMESEPIVHTEIGAGKNGKARHSVSKPLLSRPLPLSEIRGGRRRVPKLINAQGIPFLMYSKPQPTIVSHMIRRKVRQRTRRWDHRTNLAGTEIPLANQEEAWDSLIRRQGKQEASQISQATEVKVPQFTNDKVSWDSAPRDADRVLAQEIDGSALQTLSTAHRMLEIMGEERKLAKEERQQSRALKEKDSPAHYMKNMLSRLIPESEDVQR